MVRITILDLVKNHKGMGTIEDVDGTMYRATEI